MNRFTVFEKQFARTFALNAAAAKEKALKDAAERKRLQEENQRLTEENNAKDDTCKTTYGLLLPEGTEKVIKPL